MKEIQPQQIWNQEKMEGIKKLIQKQKLIDMMEQDEQLGLYQETKCYCGHTTTCDCGPEEPKQEDMLTKIMQMDAKMAYDSLPKQSTKDRILSETSEEIKQKVRDIANRLVMKQETPEEAGNKLLWKKYPYHPPKDAGYWKDMFSEGAKWQQERSYSEEDMIESYLGASRSYSKGFDEWFEQFKKK